METNRLFPADRFGRTVDRIGPPLPSDTRPHGHPRAVLGAVPTPAHPHAVTTLRDQTLPAARSAFDTAHKAYREGVTDYINVLDAERTLIDTQYQHVASLSEYHRTVIALESLLGISLDPE